MIAGMSQHQDGMPDREPGTTRCGSCDLPTIDRQKLVGDVFGLRTIRGGPRPAVE